MNEFLRLLNQDKPALIMSLPKNDPLLCAAAFEAGADVVKVHINVEHRASGNCFGRLAQERAALDTMLAAAKGPMGLVLGGTLEHARLDAQEAAAMGFDFFSLYAHHTPCMAFSERQVLMAACDGTYGYEEIEAMADMGAAVLEASIMPGTEYGQSLSLRDLLKYRAIVARTTLPVVVPTQRRILPADVPALVQTGIRGIMIGAVVTGDQEATIRESVSAFRKAIDRG